MALRDILRSVAGGLRREEADDHLVVVYGETCRMEDAITVALNSGLASNIRGVYVELLRSKPSKLVRMLEATLTTYEVMLERNPASASLKTKMNVLSRLVDGVLKGRVVDAVLALRFGGVECKSLKELVAVFELVGCSTKVLCGSTKLLSPPRGFVDYRKLAEALAKVVKLRTPSPPYASIYLGHDLRTRAPIFLPLADSRGSLHTIVVGPTGSGKTTLLATIAVRAASLGLAETGVYVVDPKGDLASMLAKLRDELKAGGLAVYDLSQLDEAEKADRVASVVDSLVRRTAAAGVKLLIVDEAWRLSSNYGAMSRLMREARAYNVAVVMASQDPGDYPDAVWNNVSNVIAFGTPSRAYRERLERYVPLGADEAELLSSLGVGRALLWSKPYGRVVPVSIDVEPLVLKHSMGG